MAVDIIFATGDAGIHSTATSYTSARNGNVITVNPDGTTVAWVGQYASFGVEEYLGQFDTSGVGSDLISATTLAVWIVTDHSTQEFQLRARAFDYGGTVDAGDYVPGDILTALPLLATLDSTAVTAGAYNAFTDVAFPANVNHSGQTRIVISSDRTGANLAPVPGTDEDVMFNTSTQTGTTNDPKLTVTHNAPGTGAKAPFIGGGFF